MDRTEFNLRSTLNVLMRHIWFIIVTFIVVVGATLAVIPTLKPIYQATTLVLVDPSDKNLLEPTSSSSSASADSARVDSEMTIAKAEPTLEMVIDEIGLVDDPEFAPTPRLRDRILILLNLAPEPVFSAQDIKKAAIAKLRDSIVVDRRGLTYLLTISANASTPQKATLIANTAAKMYIRAQVQAKVNSIIVGRDILLDRTNEARAKVVSSEQAFNDFIIASAAKIAEATGRSDVEGMRQTLENSVLTRERVTAQIDLATSGLANDEWLQVVQSLDNPLLDDVRNRQLELQAQIKQATEGSELERSLRVQMLAVADNFKQKAQDEIDALRREVAESRAQEADIQLQLRASILSSNLPPEVLASMYEMQQDADIARTQYQTMLGRLRDIEVQSSLQLADSRVVSEATAPNTPAFPNVRFLLFVAGLGSLILGAGFALLREYITGGVSSTAQLERMARSSLVVSVPNARGKGRAAKNALKRPADLVTEHPYSRFAESVRRVMIAADQVFRRNRDEKSRAGTASIVVVTSTKSGEGKSTVAAALARSYAGAGKEVILVDANLQNPGIHIALNLDLSDNLIKYLKDDKAFSNVSKILQDDISTSAKVVPGDADRDGMSEQIVFSPAFSKLLNQAAQMADVVIIDAPAMADLVDALYLSRFADVIINVVHYGDTSRREVETWLAELTEAKHEEAEIVFVLNDDAHAG